MQVADFNKDEFNKLCIEFLGAVYRNDAPIDFPNGYWEFDINSGSPVNFIFGVTTLEELAFCSSYDWLMEIVRRIQKLPLTEVNYYILQLRLNHSFEDIRCAVYDCLKKYKLQ